MSRTRRLLASVAVALALALVLPAGVVVGLVGTAAVAPKDFPRFDPRAAEGRAVMFAPAPRSGGAPMTVRATPALGAARARLLDAHSRFLRRERYASAILDRYRPTVTRPGRRPTPALIQMLGRTIRAHEKARRDLAGVAVPAALADAHAATLRMLDAAAQAHRDVIAAGRARDPRFALARDAPYTRALGEHYTALSALRSVPSEGARASIVPAES